MPLAAAGRFEAFAAWASGAAMAQWWWPQWPDTTYELDVRTGGEYRIGSATAGTGITGHYVTVDAPTLLAMTRTWLDGTSQGQPDLVTVLFAANDGSTTH